MTVSAHEMDDVPEARAESVPDVAAKRRRGISLIWLIPLVAGAVAAWLAYTTLKEQGPTITITFDTAEGIEAGTTRVKYKDVEVGLVEHVGLSADLSHVVVTAAMDNGAKAYMNETTRFWVVRPRVGFGGVSGLGTLVSGAYIELDPGQGEPTKAFKGLEEPPPIRSDAAGRRFTLQASDLGSIAHGSPVYYRDIEVGQVLDYRLADDQRSLIIQIFVDAPHDRLVRANSRFWHASGIDVSVGPQGIDVSMASLATLIAGGIAFNAPNIEELVEPAPKDATFTLYENQRKANQEDYGEKVPYVAYFDGSVRGLRAGAPVEFRGLQVGTVTGLRLQVDAGGEFSRESIRIPVTLELEPGRIDVAGGVSGADNSRGMKRLVQQGLRAQLKSGNLLTGDLVVALDFHPYSRPAELGMTGTYPEIPTVPADLEVITSSLTDLLRKIAKLPIDDLVRDLQQTVASVNELVSSPATKETAVSLGRAAVSLEALVADLEPRLGSFLSQAEKTLVAADELVNERSPIRYDVSELLKETTAAARSIRLLADYLERHPEALLTGK